MAIASIGTATADWDAGDEILFPPVTLKDKNGHQFFIRVNPITTTTEYQYLNLIAVFSNGQNPIETVLEGKFFPKGRMLLFTAAAPKIKKIDEFECRILAIPKEFYPGKGTVRQIEVELLWEDDEDLGEAVVCA